MHSSFTLGGTPLTTGIPGSVDRQTQAPTRSYRCTYHPKDLYGQPVAAESGVLPCIRLKAANAEQATLLAHATLGCVIVNAERIEPEDELAGVA
jgi:hypothetical protein